MAAPRTERAIKKPIDKPSKSLIFTPMKISYKTQIIVALNAQKAIFEKRMYENLDLHIRYGDNDHTFIKNAQYWRKEIQQLEASHQEVLNLPTEVD